MFLCNFKTAFKSCVVGIHGAAAPAPGFSAVRMDRPETKKIY